MSTLEGTAIPTGRRRRRRHSALFKAEAVGACQQSGVSIAAVALARGLNANMLRDWVRKAERSGRPIAIRPTEPSDLMPGTEGFMPVSLPASSAASSIHIEIRRNGRSVSIEWPTSAAHECALLLREFVK
jgi:transposase-like protein